MRIRSLTRFISMWVKHNLQWLITVCSAFQYWRIFVLTNDITKNSKGKTKNPNVTYQYETIWYNTEQHIIIISIGLSGPLEQPNAHGLLHRLFRLRALLNPEPSPLQCRNVDNWPNPFRDSSEQRKARGIGWMFRILHERNYDEDNLCGTCFKSYAQTG